MTKNSNKKDELFYPSDIFKEKFTFSDGIFWGLAYFYELNERNIDPESMLIYPEVKLINIDHRDRKLGIGLWHRMWDDDELFYEKLMDLSKCDFEPPNTEEMEGLKEMMLYAMTLSRFYNEITFYGLYKNEKNKIAMVELSMAKIAEKASRFFTIWDRGFLDIIRRKSAAEHRNQAKKQKAEKRKQQIIESYYTIKHRNTVKPYTLAQIIRKRYVLTGPNDKIPSLRTIVRRLKEEKLIN